MTRLNSVFSPKSQINIQSCANIQVSRNVINAAPFVKSLGLCLNSNLTMEPQVNEILRSCYFYMRNIVKIRNCITDDAFKTCVQSLITSLLDYGNILLNGQPQNCCSVCNACKKFAARLVIHISLKEHKSLILVGLHMLPVAKGPKFKILMLIFNAFHVWPSSYIRKLIVQYIPARTPPHNQCHI